MKRLILAWLLALALVWAACSDDDDNPILPPVDGNTVDLSVFEGCWHVLSLGTVFGEAGPCRTALDSVVGILTVAGAESLFAVVDTVTHLSLVAPYYGTGDFDGTEISGRNGTILAEYRHPAADCSLVTRLTGSILASGDTAFFIDYIVEIAFAGDSACTDVGDCTAFVTFTCRKRPDWRCGL